MTPSTIKKAALQMTPRQRRALADTLLKSVQEDTDAVIALEIDRRMKRFRANPKNVIPFEEVDRIVEKAIAAINKSKWH